MPEQVYYVSKKLKGQGIKFLNYVQGRHAVDGEVYNLHWMNI